MINTIIEFLKGLKPGDIVLLCFFILICLIRISFNLFTLFKVIYKKNRNLNPQNNQYSILITIRNEEQNLKEKLPLILKTNYPDFEVIVVDDYSQDSSFTILGLLKEKYPNLRISSLNQETRFSSKLARNVAIKAAKYNWIINIDPSTQKPKDEWFKKFSESINDQTNLIIGYSNLSEQKGFFHLLYRLEQFFQQLMSYSFIKLGAGYVINENNLAFKKEEYFSRGGFASEMNEEYANFELLINKFIRKKNTAIVLTPETILREDQVKEKQDYKELLIKSWRLKNKLKTYKRILFSINNSIRFLFLPLFVTLILIYPTLLIPLIIVALFVTIARIILVFSALNYLTERKLFISSLVYELLMPYVKPLFKWVYFHPTRKRKWKT